MLENLKIKEIIYRYRDYKKEYPKYSEDQLCRLVIQRRLKDYPHLYNLRNGDEKTIESFINDVFKKELNLKDICRWFMEEEYPKYNLLENSQDPNGWRTRIKKLNDRIDNIVKKTPGI